MVEDGAQTHILIEPIAPEQKDRVLYDRPADRWDYGERRDRVVAMPLYRWTWTNIAGGCLDEPPTADYWLDVEFCESIYIMCSTLDPRTVGANTDFNVESSPDGANWDTVPWATINLGANVIQSMVIAVGMKFIRMRIDNNDGTVVCCWAIVKRLK